jgi:hypothetical protein
VFPKDPLIQKVIIRDLATISPQSIADPKQDFGAWTKSASEIFVRDLAPKRYPPAVLRTIIAVNARHEGCHVHQFAATGGPPKTYEQMMQFEIEAYEDIVSWLASAEGKGIAANAKTPNEIGRAFGIYARELKDEITRVNRLRPPVDKEAHFRAFLVGQGTNKIRKALRAAKLTNASGDAEPMLPLAGHSRPADLY